MPPIRGVTANTVTPPLRTPGVFARFSEQFHAFPTGSLWNHLACPSPREVAYLVFGLVVWLERVR